jgi:hypothetical protein
MEITAHLAYIGVMKPSLDKLRTIDRVAWLNQSLQTEWRRLVGQGVAVGLAGFAAGRFAAVAWQAETVNLPPLRWLERLGSDLVPTLFEFRQIWELLAPLAPIAIIDAPSTRELERLRAVWLMLGTTESIMETGGDVRLLRDPQTGLNGYGCSHRPRPWAITFASSTASSVSERGYQAGDRARLRITAALLNSGNRRVVAHAVSSMRRRIRTSLGVPVNTLIVLAASGTDSELLALSFVHLGAGSRPMTAILLAPEETGSGVPMAARGQHFAIDTANGHDVAKAAPIEGFRADTDLVSIPLRDAHGEALAPAIVQQDITEAIARAIGAGRRPVLHALDLSKTGLLAPSMAGLQALRARFGAAFDLVVDACQLRIAPERLCAYLALDAIVLVTGSKFLTGPPFAGAALVPPAIAARLEHGVLPAGLDAYFGRAEWPGRSRAVQNLPDTANYGLLLRWWAALAEWRAFAAVPDERKAALLDRFAATVKQAIARHRCLELLPLPPLERDGGVARQWDDRRMIFSFAVRDPARPDRLLGPAQARLIYQWLNADCSGCFDRGRDPAAHALAQRICHIGQPVALADAAGDLVGWLRVSAGARLISGEPSFRHLSFEKRVDREMADLATVFDKVALLHQNWGAISAVKPQSRYQSSSLDAFRVREAQN